MRDFTDNCVVLKISDYRDNDRIAKVLTAENGLVTVHLRGVKKPKAKLKPFAQAFSVFQTRLVCNRGSFMTPVDPMLIADGFGLCADLKTFTAASVAAEATAAAIGDDEPHTDIFVEFLKFIKALGGCGDPYYTATVYMLHLLRATGFYREYTYTENPTTQLSLLGYAQRTGYEARQSSDLARRALKYLCVEFEKNFDSGLKSLDSIDLYAD